jgi:redox-sensitive bicupin YhaK (pirin superfamily)
MFGTEFRSNFRNLVHPPDARSSVTAGPRRVALLANGRRHGPITRLITPWDIGEVTSPFVLLNYAEAARRSRPLFGIHAPSGVRTLTVVLNGRLSFEDETGKRGEVAAAGFAWMKSGSVIWHECADAASEALRVFHLWVEHPVGQGERAPSEYMASDEVEEHGPVKVLLGEFGRARSRIRQAPAGLNFFHVRLGDRQNFRYAAPDGHNITWLAVDRGSLQLQVGERVLWEQIALFGDSAGMIEVRADGDTSFVLGSAARRRSRSPERDYSAPGKRYAGGDTRLPRS